MMARWSATSSATPKWMSARRSGLRRSISSSVSSHCSYWKSGGGDTGSTCGAGNDADACRVAGVQRPVGREVRDVVRRVARRRKALEADDVGADNVDVLLGHRRELAPELVERVSVEAACAGVELARVDEVRRSDLRHVHLEAGVLAHERARGARVVEVDVREQQVADVGQGETVRGQPVLQPRDADRRPAVEERRTVVRLEDVGADDLLGRLVVEVDRLELHDGSPGAMWPTFPTSR